MFFDKSIDNKPIVEGFDGVLLKDLGESIFTTGNIFNGTSITIAKVSKGMNMRPDIVSRAVYGDETYTELMLKYNNIQNPFTIQEEDILVLPSSINIENNVVSGTENNDSNSGKSDDSLIRQFHKYVDKSKKPDTTGSQQNGSSVPKTSDSGNGGNIGNVASGVTSGRFKEANLATLGATAIKEIDGKLYFGADADIKCASDGISTSDYLKKVIQNSSNK